MTITMQAQMTQKQGSAPVAAMLSAWFAVPVLAACPSICRSRLHASHRAMNAGVKAHAKKAIRAIEKFFGNTVGTAVKRSIIRESEFPVATG